MTGIVLLDKYNFNDYITTRYPENYEYEGKVAYIPENIVISVENLLELLLVYSANDAAYIAALAVSENLETFITLMNLAKGVTWTFLIIQNLDLSHKTGSIQK